MNTKIKRNATILLAVLLMLSWLILPAGAAADSEVTITVIHVNDRHGRVSAEPYISQMAKTRGNVLILDAGDSLHGQTAANLSKGETMVELMNAVGYSAMVAGNHDFNFGTDKLLELSGMMDFPILAANVKKADGTDLFKPYEIFDVAGVTVGVFGIASPETVTKSDPRNVAGLTFADPTETAKLMVSALKDCDVIIALVHLGMDESSAPAHRSDALAAVPGIDLIIDGHSHSKLDEGLLVGSTLIAQTGQHGQNIGIVELTVENGSVTSKSARLVAVGDDLIADEKIMAIIEEEEAKIEPITSIVVGHTPVMLQGEREFVRTSETNLANLITDSMRHATGADIAIFNGGGIRATINPGDITMGDVLSAMPYSNILVTVELTGADVLSALEHGVSEYPQQAGLFVQVSGIRFTIDPGEESGSRVKNVTMQDGSLFDQNKTYTVATIDFIAAGGDGYETIANGKNIKYYGSDAEALVAYLATNPAINADPDGRLTVEESSPTYYIVVRGDWLSKIAPRYGLTWQELWKLNPDIRNPNLIYPQQVLYVGNR
ncbi:MAG: 5'-nucleotidase C-terminal domain-containing protein [Oscillospiraceae bacterium]|nr:5'-nucleotidase C-terminal domain-containing protein [Oscillospiraceae bacterium]